MQKDLPQTCHERDLQKAVHNALASASWASEGGSALGESWCNHLDRLECHHRSALRRSFCCRLFFHRSTNHILACNRWCIAATRQTFSGSALDKASRTASTRCATWLADVVQADAAVVEVRAGTQN
eukprot:m.274262 g.274262  ORF g.274262 m.274262 type:complete len:126 (-) comp16133_c0_seq1:262-639(-)